MSSLSFGTLVGKSRGNGKGGIHRQYTVRPFAATVVGKAEKAIIEGLSAIKGMCRKTVFRRNHKFVLPSRLLVSFCTRKIIKRQH